MRKSNKLIQACRENDLKKVKYLVERGADINNDFLNGGNVLSVACAWGNFQIVKYLIENGADPDTVYKFKSHPRIYRPEIVNYIENQKLLKTLKEI